MMYSSKEMKPIKPKKLRPGSTIGILSPSSGLPHLFPQTYELGLQNLREQLGFQIVELPTSRMSDQQLYERPQARADDLNAAFADPAIDGIITSIGGYESVRILPYVDTDLILRHPKFIMGFSDATTFLSYLNSLGMVTFQGPSVMAGFAQMNHLPTAFTEHVRTFLFADDFPYRYVPYSEYTSGYIDWGIVETIGQCKPFQPNKNGSGWYFIQGGDGNRAVEGRLWGGCLEVLEFLKGTPFWPDASFWEDKILLFETSEEKPAPKHVGYMLRNYGMQGILSKVRGIVFSRPFGYTDKEKEELGQIITDIVTGEFGRADIQIVTDVYCGNTDPKLIMPFGCRLRLDPVQKEIVLLENPFE
jgi:muramoyltetrapeptide carboxypeptidase LdcA involved in peptidoglycan recycling